MTNQLAKLLSIMLVSCMVIGFLGMSKAGAFDFTINIDKKSQVEQRYKKVTKIEVDSPKAMEQSVFSFPWKWHVDWNFRKWIPWHININNSADMREIELSGEIKNEDVKSIEIKSLVSTVRFYKNTKESKDLIYYELKGDLSKDNEEPEIKVAEKDGVLSIEEKYAEKSVSSKNLNFDIFLPEKQYDYLKVKVSSGAIVLKEMSFDQVNLEASTGSIIVRGDYKKLNCEVGTGNMNVVIDEINDNQNFKTNTGNVDISIAKDLKYHIELTTKTGNIIHRDSKDSGSAYNHSVVDYSQGVKKAPIIKVHAQTGNILIHHHK